MPDSTTTYNPGAHWSDDEVLSRRKKEQIEVMRAMDLAKEKDPWAWTSHAFGTSDQELYRALKARREASIADARREIDDA